MDKGLSVHFDGRMGYPFPTSMEQAFFFWINRDWANPVLDIFFKWVSDPLSFSWPLFLVILALLVKQLGREGLFLFLLLLVTVGLGDFMGGTLKKLTLEPRPCYEMPEQVRRPGHPPGSPCGGAGSGMPSNHALNFFTLAAFMTVARKSWRWSVPLAAVAVTVGLSRIYLGVHYPRQVLAGVVIGSAWGGLSAWLGVLQFGFMKKAAGLRFGESGGPDPD